MCIPRKLGEKLYQLQPDLSLSPNPYHTLHDVWSCCNEVVQQVRYSLATNLATVDIVTVGLGENLVRLKGHLLDLFIGFRSLGNDLQKSCSNLAPMYSFHFSAKHEKKH